MKSSLRPASDFSAAEVLPAWSPADFGAAPVPTKAATAVEDILSILGSGNGLSSPAAPVDRVETSVWNPADITSLSQPFRPVWKVIDKTTPEAAPAKPQEEDINTIRQQIIDRANASAVEIVRQAEEQAALLVQQAQERADEITLQAHKEGWSAAETETAEMIRTIQEIVHQTEAWREDMLAQSENAVLDLVREMARVMFGEGFVLDQEALQNSFHNILTDARALGDLRIYVNPDDAANLDPYWREFQVSVSGQQIQIIPSENIRRGGCFIDGEWGSIDARIETQLKSILDTLTETSPKTESEGSAD